VFHRATKRTRGPSSFTAGAQKAGPVGRSLGVIGDALLHDGFRRSASTHPERPALEVAGQVLTYTELHARAAAIAATLRAMTPPGGPPLTAVFAYRSATAFAGVLGALMAGDGYVPLNRTFPEDRTRGMLTRAGCRAVVVDSQSAAQLDSVLDGVEDRLLLILPDLDDVSELAARHPGHLFLGAADLLPAAALEPRDASPDDVAYLLFTSGSTGVPKGVMVAHHNATSFVETIVERYDVVESDRLSQTFDMTFDLSVFDMFVAWERGACVCCPAQAVLLNPGKFIRESALTIWFSVPSIGVFMKRLGALKPDRYPGLRLSLFCGEPLPMEVARAWAAAAPNAALENLYGPTELTIACTLYRWEPKRSPAECEMGVVPIGEPFETMHALVVDESLEEVAPGQDGELIMTGPQLTPGYWRAAERTAAAFVRPPGRGATYYRTGDRVRRPVGSGPLVYRGRLDHQIKINGHRVELGEVEAALRAESGVDAAVAIGWPVTVSGAGAILAFLGTTDVDVRALREHLARRLPDYMVPREIRLMERLPLNANGKIDRRALTDSLAEVHEAA
jgi:amino acid adenylation domain-containing protein